MDTAWYSQADLRQIPIDPRKVIAAVRSTLLPPSDGRVVNPPKLFLGDQATGFAIGMLAASEISGLIGFKIYLERQSNEPGASVSNLIHLFEHSTFKPLAVMDCERITALRTAAVTSIFMELAAPQTRHVLVIGGGQQGKAICSILAATMDEGEIWLASKQSNLAWELDREARASGHAVSIHRVEDLARAAGRCETVIGAAGPGTPLLVRAHMLKPGALAVILGHGLHPEILEHADRVLATSRAQMHATGQDLATSNGKLREVDAELWQIIAGVEPARKRRDDLIFAYNSGLAVTDLAVARLFLDYLNEDRAA